jgi:homocitrate synthase NifV
MIGGKLRGKFTPEDVIQSMVDAAHAAKETGALTIGVNAEDASRSDLDYLIRFALAAKEAGADRLRYCDTVGGDTPSRIYQRVSQLAQAVGIPIELHCHNDLGLAVANSLAGAQAAVEAGVDAYINATVNGVGERAGQADLLSCILACKLSFEFAGKLELGDSLRLEVARRLANYVANAFNLSLPINQPGVGRNVFAHESGIHVDGTLKDPRNYELYDYDLFGPLDTTPSSVGRVITTGEYGGVAGLRHVYERLGIYFESQEEARETLQLVQAADAHTHRPLTDDELRFIAHHPEEVRLLLTMSLQPAHS